jgi:putative hydrolase of the HAD superfamily
MPVLEAMFFDIGGTLGEVDPTSLRLHLFPDTISILHATRALGLSLGVITNVAPTVDKDRVRAMLTEAGIANLFEDRGLITSTEAGTFKPRTAIYLFAANAMNLGSEKCVYVGEDPAQVAGAVAAGMHGILKN